MESDHDMLIALRGDVKYIKERVEKFEEIERDYVGKKSLYRWGTGLAAFAAAAPQLWHMIKGAFPNVS